MSFKFGDRVRLREPLESYGDGTVMEVTRNGVTVKWDKAKYLATETWTLNSIRPVQDPNEFFKDML